MDHAIADTSAETVLRGALELSKNSWLLALQLPDRAQPSLYPIRGGDTEGLMAKLTAARDRWAKVSGKAQTTDSRSAANKFYHSITSSARIKSVGGIVNPSALAVFRLMSSSNLMLC